MTIHLVNFRLRALKGSFDLSFRGKTAANIPVNVEQYELRQILESQLGIVGVLVYYWDHRCHRRHFPIYFSGTELTGDVELIAMNASNVVTDHKDGHWRAMDLVRNIDGGAMIEEPGGDFFRWVQNIDPAIFRMEFSCYRHVAIVIIMLMKGEL